MYYKVILIGKCGIGMRIGKRICKENWEFRIGIIFGRIFILKERVIVYCNEEKIIFLIDGVGLNEFYL